MRTNYSTLYLRYSLEALRYLCYFIQSYLRYKNFSSLNFPAFVIDRDFEHSHFDRLESRVSYIDGQQKNHLENCIQLNKIHHPPHFSTRFLEQSNSFRIPLFFTILSLYKLTFLELDNILKFFTFYLIIINLSCASPNLGILLTSLHFQCASAVAYFHCQALESACLYGLKVDFFILVHVIAYLATVLNRSLGFGIVEFIEKN